MLPYYDDRLATVIASPVPGDVLARVQYRQLLDLLCASLPASSTGALGALAVKDCSNIFTAEQIAAGITRLHLLSEQMTSEQEAEAISELHRPLSSPILLNYLLSKPETRRAALQHTAFSTQQWQMLYPSLNSETQEFISRQGVFGGFVKADENPTIAAQNSDHSDFGDILVLEQSEELVSSQPSSAFESESVAVKKISRSANLQAAPAQNLARQSDQPPIEQLEQQEQQEQQEQEDQGGRHYVDAAHPIRSKVQSISDIVARIENFTKTQNAQNMRAAAMAKLPFEEPQTFDNANPKIDFVTGGQGIVIAASNTTLLGLNIFTLAKQAGWGCNDSVLELYFNRMAIRKGLFLLPGDDKQYLNITAYPQFDKDGHFSGYAGIIYPREEAIVASENAQEIIDNSRSDHYRQLIHELRTPTGALKGFAEILHSQLFGPVSAQYRYMAKTILDDSDILLSHFDQLRSFEQGDNSEEQCADMLLTDFVRTLDSEMSQATGSAICKTSIISGGHYRIAPDIMQAFSDWLVQFVINRSGVIIVEFSAVQNSDLLRVVISDSKPKKAANLASYQEEMYEFAMLLSEARLLECGAKIDSDTHQTSMDLPTIAVINAEYQG